MIKREENDLLTQTGPGTPCGEFMRRYWMLPEELRNRIQVELGEGNRLQRNRENLYLQDRDSMKTETFSGMGFH
jgi:hypothetical protein